MRAEDVDVGQTLGREAEEGGFCVGGECGLVWECGCEELEQDSCEAGDAEVVEWVEEDDGCGVTAEVGGFECRGENGVGYGKV